MDDERSKRTQAPVAAALDHAGRGGGDRRGRDLGADLLEQLSGSPRRPRRKGGRSRARNDARALLSQGIRQWRRVDADAEPGGRGPGHPGPDAAVSPAFALAPVTTTSDARIEAGWFGDALKADRKTRSLPDETQGDERVPLLIETDYLAGGREMKARAFYDVGYALEGHFLRGASVKLRGMSLIGRAATSDTTADARLAALWEARAGKVK